MGSLGTAAMARMDEQLPWFRALSAPRIARGWGWWRRPGSPRSSSGSSTRARTGRHPSIEFFGTAPRELKRSISLQQTVDIVRVVVEVVEAQADELAAPGGEDQLQQAMLRYTRDVAFAAAQVYAREAEARGAWDARLEALIVDALVRGEVDDGAALLGRGARLDLRPGRRACAGHAPEGDPQAVIDGLRERGRRIGLDLLAGVQGDRLIVIVGGGDSVDAAAKQVVCPLRGGPDRRSAREVPDLHAAARSARAALAGLRAASGWPDAPRPVHAERPAGRAGARRRRRRPRAADRERLPAAGRHAAARHPGHLPGAGHLAGGHRAAAVRAPEHGPLPAAEDHRADRLPADGGPLGLHPAGGAHPRQAVRDDRNLAALT